jgi:hypothetical protein
MFNLKSYTEALAHAEDRAATLGTASVIKYWDVLGSCADLRIDMDWMDMDGCRIVATVDHHGIITQSEWVKEQIEKLGEVAA